MNITDKTVWRVKAPEDLASLVKKLRESVQDVEYLSFDCYGHDGGLGDEYGDCKISDNILTKYVTLKSNPYWHDDDYESDPLKSQEAWDSKLRRHSKKVGEEMSRLIASLQPWIGSKTRTFPQSQTSPKNGERILEGSLKL